VPVTAAALQSYSYWIVLPTEPMAEPMPQTQLIYSTLHMQRGTLELGLWNWLYMCTYVEYLYWYQSVRIRHLVKTSPSTPR
jgi:hypothetical protein